MGETRVAEGAAARGDGENLEPGRGRLRTRAGIRDPVARGKRQGLKKGLEERRYLGGGGWETGAGGNCRMGAGDGS